MSIAYQIVTVLLFRNCCFSRLLKIVISEFIIFGAATILAQQTHTHFEILCTKHKRNNEILNDPVAKLLNLGKLLKIVIWQLINFSPATILEQKDSRKLIPGWLRRIKLSLQENLKTPARLMSFGLGSRSHTP